MKFKILFLKLLIGGFYLPFLLIAYILGILLFIFEMTVVFTINYSKEFRDDMIIRTDVWFKKYMK